ncbi:hypothetical protein TST_1766 [Thermosulfidibacter takaii ABI70S6]|uniref:Lipoprotein n=1 Tax=Thermosulfidibacter takaii (strain DSM 17441 / JCM 13301 / NBRC 103674 / ABI70S6) TaxID=1298851 RepID=A0A0S3QW55_THET7|nr:hypothetical protein [Thermosulfidibacter takaii]BAT72550.1 hypothetical protein TST_1766 [Thermosulfidibacter takaii ABI70S6]
MSFKRTLSLFLLLLVGCSFVKQAVAPETTAYKLLVKPYHRYSVLKSDLTDMEASVDVVFLSCDLQKAITEYMKEQGVLTELEAQLREKEIEGSCHAYYDFLVAMYTKKSQWNNLEDKNPFFRVYLETQEGKRKPQLIEKVNLKDDEIATFYPFVDPWMKVYRLRFGAAGLEKQKVLKLVFASLIGRMEVSWNLQ